MPRVCKVSNTPDHACWSSARVCIMNAHRAARTVTKLRFPEVEEAQHARQRETATTPSASASLTCTRRSCFPVFPRRVPVDCTSIERWQRRFVHVRAMDQNRVRCQRAGSSELATARVGWIQVHKEMKTRPKAQLQRATARKESSRETRSMTQHSLMGETHPRATSLRPLRGSLAFSAPPRSLSFQHQ